jgi:6-phosphogluconolactonase
MADRTVHVFPDAESLASDAATRIARLARETIDARGAFRVALAGGTTPRRAYELLAEHHRDDVDWSRVEVYFGDERCVPPDDAESNFAMAWRALLSRVPVTPANVHPMYQGGELPEVAAARYDALLRRSAVTFDLTLLGVGEDGHTASLFPGAPSLAERARWASAVEAPPAMKTRWRVTLTLPALDASRRVMVLCAGAPKREVVSQVLSADPSAAEAAADRYPAAMVRGAEETVWMVDAAATG